ncbi:MAG: FecR family protein [Verrucomicrobiota bacterium]|nr:FecR family protein [Verrucomicrobiota bacterium]
MRPLTSQEREWIESYLNGSISPEAFEDLQDRMIENPVLRKAVRRYLSLDYHLQEGGSALEEATSAQRGVGDSQAATFKAHRSWPRTVWAAAASIAVLVVGLSFFLRESKASSATISAIHGPVQWTNSEGQTLDRLQPGTSLDHGLLESLLPESWIELTFQDASKLTLSGHSTLMVSVGKRKRLHLRKGSLSAEITAQPENRTMVLHTPTAELRVLGTRFDVVAQSDVTKLIVNEGRVHLKRLFDGSTAEISGGQQVVADIHDTQKPKVVPRGNARQVWQSDLAKEVTHGNWSTDFGKHAIGKLKKMVASGEINTDEGLAKYQEMLKMAAKKGHLKADAKSTSPGKGAKAVVVISLSKGTESPITVPADARFRIRGNLETSAVVEFGFTTYTTDGRFAGKLSTERTLHNLGEEGFDIEIALDTFLPRHPKFGAPVTGMEIRDWWCATRDQQAHMVITHVELLTTSP